MISHELFRLRGLNLVISFIFVHLMIMKKLKKVAAFNIYLSHSLFEYLEMTAFYNIKYYLLFLAAGNEERKEMVIIGSSFIGMEVAAAHAKKANVSVIGLEKV